jgi:thiol-disulfide isomerase/thioredoxin
MNGQSDFSDDFENYSVGKSLPSTSEIFWKNASQYYTISSEKAFQGKQSLLLKWQGNSQTTLFTLPTEGYSYEINFKIWKKPGESIDFQPLSQFHFFQLSGDETIEAYGGKQNTHFEIEKNIWHDIRIQYYHKQEILMYYINDQLASSFKASDTKLINFKVNLYDNTATYLDNFKVKVLNEPILNYDVKLFDVAATRLMMTDSKFKLHTSVINMGKDTIDGFVLDYKYGQYEKTVYYGIKLGPDDIYVFDIIDSLQALPGLNDLTVSVNILNSGLSDENPADNQLQLYINGVVPKGKKSLVEYATGAWCGTCPAAIVAYRENKRKFGDNIASIFMHTGDIMELAGYTFPDITAVPTMYFNRYPQNNVFSEFNILKAIDEEPIISMKTKVLKNTQNKEVIVSSDVTFLTHYDQPIYHSILIVEDSINNSSNAYNQANFYSSGIYGTMGGFELLPSNIPAKDMYYSNVAKQMNNGLFGKRFNVNAAPNETVTLSENINLDLTKINKHYYIYHIIMDIDRKVINVERVRISDVLKTISSTESNSFAQDVIYPNPTQDIIKIVSPNNITNIQVKNTKGQLLDINYNQVNDNEAILDLSNQNNGIYIIEISNQDKIWSKKVIKI